MPLLLIVSDGGTIGTIALIGMLMFHVHIFSTFAMGVPMEWNLFMLFGLCFLFGEYGDVSLSNLDNPLLIVLLALFGVVMPIVGNLRPDKISFLPSMRYYAGNWATSMWMFRRDTGAEEKFDREIYKVAPIAVEAAREIYDDETANYILEKGLAFRAMHSHGRALNALFARAADPADVDDYFVREGEVISGIVTGWNFGDGHFHSEQLLDAVREQCRFEPGELRVVMLESQPAHVQKQHYRIHDAATGLVEEGCPRGRDGQARPVARGVVRDAGRGHTKGAAARSQRRSREQRDRRRVGPNGLACAVALAREGVDVTVLEAEDAIGGGAPSGEATVPGLVHDICSAVHPMAVGSPFLNSLELERHGLDGAGPRSTAPIRSTTDGGHDVPVRRGHRGARWGRTARAGAGSSAPRHRRSSRSPTTCSGPSCTCRGIPCGSSGSGCRPRCRRRCSRARGGRRRHARCSAASRRTRSARSTGR